MNIQYFKKNKYNKITIFKQQDDILYHYNQSKWITSFVQSISKNTRFGLELTPITVEEAFLEMI